MMIYYQFFGYHCCGHKIVLRKDMSFGKICLFGVHVFQDDMSYGGICLKGDNAL